MVVIFPAFVLTPPALVVIFPAFVLTPPALVVIFPALVLTSPALVVILPSLSLTAVSTSANFALASAAVAAADGTKSVTVRGAPTATQRRV